MRLRLLSLQSLLFLFCKQILLNYFFTTSLCFCDTPTHIDTRERRDTQTHTHVQTQTHLFLEVWYLDIFLDTHTAAVCAKIKRSNSSSQKCDILLYHLSDHGAFKKNNVWIVVLCDLSFGFRTCGIQARIWHYWQPSSYTQVFCKEQTSINMVWRGSVPYPGTTWDEIWARENSLSSLDSGHCNPGERKCGALL